MDISLHNKVAVVNGGSQGIGLATAKALAALGATCNFNVTVAEAMFPTPAPIRRIKTPIPSVTASTCSTPPVTEWSAEVVLTKP